jgi:hypothetical protein
MGGEAVKGRVICPTAKYLRTPADGTPDKNPAQQEGAAMSDEMDNARDQEEIKTITNLLTEIKAIRAEMKT